MILTFFLLVLINKFVFSIETNQTNLDKPCLDLNLVNGNVSLEKTEKTISIHIKCYSPYDLVGPAKMQCINGKWEPNFIPQCVARCNPPPFIWNGGFQVEGVKSEDGMFKKGTLVTYTCSPGYYLTPPESKYRVCTEGLWTGIDAYCEPVGCKPPEPIKNGYYVHENIDMTGNFGVGERLHYSCNNDYILVGTSTQKCLADGSWSPKIPPKCTENGKFIFN